MKEITQQERLLASISKWNQWREEETIEGIDLRGADLQGADLRWADLQKADLQKADLREADLQGADLRWADLRWADLQKADLREADLRDADLRDADLQKADLQEAHLQGADLREADLHNTCLDRELLKKFQIFSQQCPHLDTGQRVVYRTNQSQSVGKTSYLVGIYTAPVFSFSVETSCHPGIYAGSLEWMLRAFPNEDLVRCAVWDWHWFFCAKGCIRCVELEVLAEVTNLDQERHYLHNLKQHDPTIGPQRV